MTQLPLKIFRNLILSPNPWGTMDSKRGPCWIWKGGKNPAGYGMARFDGKVWMVRHLVHSLFGGSDIPRGSILLSHCGNRACCSPKHFELVTRVEARRIQDEWVAEHKRLRRKAKLEREEKRRLELGVTEDWCV